MQLDLIMNNLSYVVGKLKNVFLKDLSDFCKLLYINEAKNAAYFSSLRKSVNFVLNKVANDELRACLAKPLY